MNIRDMIRERGLLQKWVAREIGIEPSAFSLMVNGEKPIPPDKISPLAKALRFPVKAVREAAGVSP
jgi:plasmid maintenance system antidote protein VapI